MATSCRWLVIALAALLVQPAGAQEPARPPDKAAEREYLRGIADAVRGLILEVARFEEQVVTELGGPREHDFYRRADQTLARLQAFQKSLKPGVRREQFYKDYEAMEHQLRELLEVVGAAGKDQRWLRRAAERITDADQQLHYALSHGDVTQARGREVLQRQAQALAAAARELNQTAQFALAKDAPGRAGLEDSLRKLADATQRFEETARKASDPASLQAAFAPVNDAWKEVARGLRLLPPHVNAFLVRSAERVDVLHERLFRQLHMKGERPRIILDA